MSFLPYMVLAGLVVVLAVGCGAIALMGTDAFMARGAGAGAAAGLSLMAFSWFTTLKGIKARDKTNALGHILGGFMLRLVVLSAGFFLLAFTGWGHAGGFAIAFLMAVMTYLALQILVAARNMQSTELTTA